MKTKKYLTYFSFNLIWNTIDIVVSYSFNIRVFTLTKENSISKMLGYEQETNKNISIICNDWLAYTVCIGNFWSSSLTIFEIYWVFVYTFVIKLVAFVYKNRFFYWYISNSLIFKLKDSKDLKDSNSVCHNKYIRNKKKKLMKAFLCLM